MTANQTDGRASSALLSIPDEWRIDVAEALRGDHAEKPESIALHDWARWSLQRSSEGGHCTVRAVLGS